MKRHKGIWGSVALDLPHSFVFQLGLCFCLFYKDLVAVYGNRERKVSATTIDRNCVAKNPVYRGDRHKSNSLTILKLIFMK